MLDLYAATSSFYQKIPELSRIYNWERAVLPLAIDIHTYIVSVSASDPNAWVIPDPLKAQFCKSNTVSLAFMISRNQTFLGQRKRDTHNVRSKPICTPEESTNSRIVVCEAFNMAKDCSYPSCERSHQCKDVDLKDITLLKGITSLYGLASLLVHKSLLWETKNQMRSYSILDRIYNVFSIIFYVYLHHQDQIQHHIFCL